MYLCVLTVTITSTNMKTIPDIAQDLEILLEYIENNNKEDEDVAVAQAAQNLEVVLATYRDDI